MGDSGSNPEASVPVPVVLAGRDPLRRAALRQLLVGQSWVSVVDEGWAQGAQVPGPEHAPAVMLLDGAGGSGEVLAAIRVLTADGDQRRVVVVGGDPKNADLAVSTFMAGATGLLYDDEVTSPLLVAAVCSVASGGIAFGARGGASLAGYLRRTSEEVPPALADRVEGLTPRQRAVFDLLGKPGRTNGEIAAMLAVSPETVKTHLKAIYLALGVTRRAEAVHIATRLRTV